MTLLAFKAEGGQHVGLSLLCSKICLLFFWECPPKTTYYSHTFILLFSNYSHDTKSHLHQKKNHVPCTKSTQKQFELCARENICSVAAEEGLPLDTVRDSLGNAFTLTAACEAPVPENKIFSLVLSPIIPALFLYREVPIIPKIMPAY